MVASDPHIISRAQWGANPLQTPAGTIETPSKELWLHHSAGEQFDEAGMRMLQSFTLHRPDAHYVDLEYSLVLDRKDCRIFESRGVGRDSAATFDHNSISHAICVMGNFEIDEPSDALIQTLANLVAWGYEHEWWPLGFTGGHRDASHNSTACPGTKLWRRITDINALAVRIHVGSVTPVPPGPTPSPVPQPVPGLEEDDPMAIICTRVKSTVPGREAWVDFDPDSKTLFAFNGPTFATGADPKTWQVAAWPKNDKNITGTAKLLLPTTGKLKYAELPAKNGVAITADGDGGTFSIGYHQLDS